MKKYKIGVLGAGRGVDLAKNFLRLGCEIVALCDSDSARLEYGVSRLRDVPTFTDFDEFLNCEMDAVIIANLFHQHTPYVIKCFERGLHVFCECTSNGTMAEGVELYRAYKNTKSIYFLAENYPQMVFNREMQRVCRGGTLGKIQGGVQTGDGQLLIPERTDGGGDGMLVEGAATAGQMGELEEVIDFNAGKLHVQGGVQDLFPAQIAPATGGKGEFHTDSSS